MASHVARLIDGPRLLAAAQRRQNRAACASDGSDVEAQRPRGCNFRTRGDRKRKRGHCAHLRAMPSQLELLSLPLAIAAEATDPQGRSGRSALPHGGPPAQNMAAATPEDRAVPRETQNPAAGRGPVVGPKQQAKLRRAEPSSDLREGPRPCPVSPRLLETSAGTAADVNVSQHLGART